jgi:hypothetical protein
MGAVYDLEECALIHNQRLTFAQKAVLKNSQQSTVYPTVIEQ